MTKLTIEIDVPEQYTDHLETEIRNAVRAIRNRYICPSTYGDDTCVLDAGHDGPICTDGVREWPCPFGDDVPAAGQRVFEPGRKVRHRSSGTVYEMVSFNDDVVRLDSGPSTSYEAVGSSFWATYYAIAGRPQEPTVTVREDHEAVAALDALTGTDGERDHGKAHEILKAYLPETVREAWNRAEGRAGGHWFA